MTAEPDLNLCIQQWLEKVTAWQDDPSTSSIIQQQLEAHAELKRFLQTLSAAVQSQNSLDTCMNQWPMIGQFLGRLCSLPALLSSDWLVEALFSCLMLFYTQQPKTKIQHRAKLWVASLLKKLVTSSNQFGEQATTETLGVSAHQMNTMLQEKILSTWCPTKLKKSEWENLLTLTLKSVAMPTLCPLLDRVTSQLANEKPEWFKQLAEKHLCTSKTPLPYHTQLLVWQKCANIVERDVLTFVQHCVENLEIWNRQVIKDAAPKNLVLACCEDPTIHQSVLTVFHRLLRHQPLLMYVCTYWAEMMAANPAANGSLSCDHVTRNNVSEQLQVLKNYIAIDPLVIDEQKVHQLLHQLQRLCLSASSNQSASHQTSSNQSGSHQPSSSLSASNQSEKADLDRSFSEVHHLAKSSPQDHNASSISATNLLSVRNALVSNVAWLIAALTSDPRAFSYLISCYCGDNFQEEVTGYCARLQTSPVAPVLSSEESPVLLHIKELLWLIQGFNRDEVTTQHVDDQTHLKQMIAVLQDFGRKDT